MKICVIYDKICRPDTIGVYYEAALRRTNHEITYLDIPASQQTKDEYDLYIHIDDDFPYGNKFPKEKSVYVIVDGHRMWGSGGWHTKYGLNGFPFWRISKAWSCKWVFVSQAHIVEALRSMDIDAYHLPTAVDPDYWHPVADVEKKYDWCAIGNNYGPKEPIINALKEAFPNCYTGTAYGEDACKIMSESKIALNTSFGNDINMRIYEVMGCGAYLFTNRVKLIESIFPEDWITEGPSQHPYQQFVYDFEYPSYKNNAVESMRVLLGMGDEWIEENAAKFRNKALKYDTYDNRVKTILETIGVENK